MTDAPETPQYLAEFVDGPLADTTSLRFLTDGSADERVSEIVQIKGQEALLWYRADEQRDIDGTLHVRYLLEKDTPEEQAVEDNADEDTETRTL